MDNYIILKDTLIAYTAVAIILTDLIVRAKREACISNSEFESSLKIYQDA
jgi:hypothetical protein